MNYEEVMLIVVQSRFHKLILCVWQMVLGVTTVGMTQHSSIKGLDILQIKASAEKLVCSSTSPFLPNCFTMH